MQESKATGFIPASLASKTNTTTRNRDPNNQRIKTANSMQKKPKINNITQLGSFMSSIQSTTTVPYGVPYQVYMYTLICIIILSTTPFNA